MLNFLCILIFKRLRVSPKLKYEFSLSKAFNECYYLGKPFRLTEPKDIFNAHLFMLINFYLF